MTLQPSYPQGGVENSMIFVADPSGSDYMFLNIRPLVVGSDPEIMVGAEALGLFRFLGEW